MEDHNPDALQDAACEALREADRPEYGTHVTDAQRARYEKYAYHNPHRRRDVWAVVYHSDGSKHIMRTAYVNKHEQELMGLGYDLAMSGFQCRARAELWAESGGWPNVTANHPN